MLYETGMRLFHHPMAERYNTRDGQNNRIYTPEDVLGERLSRLGALLLVEHAMPDRLILPEPSSGFTREEALLNFVRTALDTVPYLWTEEVRTTMRAIEVPRCSLTVKLLPAARSWHTYETGISLGGHLEVGGVEYHSSRLDCSIAVDTKSGIGFYYLGEMDGPDGPVITITGGVYPYQRVYPDDLDEAGRVHLHGFLAKFAFLNSPYIPKERRRPSRAARRDAARAGVAVDDEVTFVLLRRPVARRGETTEPEAVDWKHRWLVNGHVRAQWYPSEQAHRLIWIAPYLKGPDGAPMLDHAYKVSR